MWEGGRGAGSRRRAVPRCQAHRVQETCINGVQGPSGSCLCMHMHICIDSRHFMDTCPRKAPLPDQEGPTFPPLHTHRSPPTPRALSCLPVGAAWAPSSAFRSGLHRGPGRTELACELRGDGHPQSFSAPRALGTAPGPPGPTSCPFLTEAEEKVTVCERH